MFNGKIHGILILLCLLIPSGCSDNGVNPVPGGNQRYGWVTGDVGDSSYGTVLFTTDGGENWISQGSVPELRNLSVHDVCALSVSSIWIVCDSNMILKSQDCGKNWTRQQAPPLIPVPALHCVRALNIETAWISGESGAVYKTTNSGINWVRKGEGFFPAINIQGILPVNENVIYCAGQRGSAGGGFAAVSKDGGATWDTIAKPPGLNKDFIDIGAVDTDNVYIFGEKGYYMSTTNAGADWTWNLTALQTGDLNSIAMIDKNTFWFACDFDNILYTSNAGAGWTLRVGPPPMNFFLVGSCAVNGSVVYMTGMSAGYPSGGKVIKTTDGGSTWCKIYEGSVNLGKVSFIK